MVLAPFSPSTAVIASDLKLYPAWRVKWYGLKTAYKNRNGAETLSLRLALLASRLEGLGYLFHVEAGIDPNNTVFRLKFYKSDKAVNYFGASPIMISPSSDLTVELASIPTASLVDETALVIEHYTNYLAFYFNGSELLKTTTPASYILDTLKTLGAFSDANGSPVDVTVLSFVDIEKPFDTSFILPIVISSAVTAIVLLVILKLLGRVF